MYYYFYKITNKLNGKKYLGVHKTDNLEDDYMGSGVLLSKAKEKYGIENFTKEILKYFNNEEDMFCYEGEIVNETIVNDPNYYNVALGGHGGNTYAGKSGDEMVEIKQKLSVWQKGKLKPHKGTPRSNETRQKISEAKKNKNKPGNQCIINGIKYISLADAAKKFGLTYKCFYNRYNKGYYS